MQTDFRFYKLRFVIGENIYIKKLNKEPLHWSLQNLTLSTYLIVSYQDKLRHFLFFFLPSLRLSRSLSLFL